MSDTGQHYRGLITTSLLAAAVLVGSIVYFDRPFQPARSPSDSATSPIESRLWEDPLKPLHSIQSQISNRVLNGQDISKNYLDEITDGPQDILATILNNAAPVGQKITVLGVHLPDDSYFLNAEVRRRIRYSVVSAINQTHTPFHSRNLSILKNPSSTQALPDYLPYELFMPSIQNGIGGAMLEQENSTEPDKKPEDSLGKIDDLTESQAKDFREHHMVLVMWLPDSVVDDDILSGFADLVRALELPNDLDVNPVLLGPHNSTGLLNLYTELNIQRMARAVLEIKSKSGDIEIDNSISSLAILDLILDLDAHLDSSLVNDQVFRLSKCIRDGITHQDYSNVLIECFQPIATRSQIEQINEYLEKPDNKLDQASEIFQSCIDSGSLSKLQSMSNESCKIGDAKVEAIFAQHAPDTTQYFTHLPLIARNVATKEDRLEQRISVISPRATIANEFISNAIGTEVFGSLDQNQGQSGSRSTTSLQNTNTLGRNQVFRSVQDDGKLMRELFLELTQSRGINPGSSRIALIYESDSEYGRALLEYLICDGVANNVDSCFNRDNVSSFSYLRGIDGRMSASSSSTSSTASGAATITRFEDLATNLQSLETPIGTHQYDYLRRVSALISEGNYQAIGVLGTDIYDKLLVLQAIRQENQSSLFFTTDLYSYLYHASQWDWTKNLIVASSDHTSANYSASHRCRAPVSTPNNPAGSQGSQASTLAVASIGTEVPPLRDSYQSSYFYSTCVAVGQLADTTFRSLEAEDNLAANDPAKIRRMVESRGNIEANLKTKVNLYEISRFNAETLEPSFFHRQTANSKIPFKSFSPFDFDLAEILGWLVILAPIIVITVYSAVNLDRTKIALAPMNRNLRAGLSIFLLLGVVTMYCLIGIVRFLPFSSGTIFMLFACIVLAAFLLELDNKRIRLKLLSNIYLCTLVLCMFCIYLVFLLVYLEYIVPGGESILFWRGTSQWPHTILRIEAVAISFCFALYTFKKWRQSNKQIRKMIYGRHFKDRRQVVSSVREELYAKGAGFWERWNRYRIPSWRKRLNKQSDLTPPFGNAVEKKQFTELWEEYIALGELKPRGTRVLTQTITISFFVFFVLAAVTPQPNLIRSSIPAAELLFSDFFIFISAFIILLLISLGNDVTNLGREFLRSIRKHPISWEQLEAADIGSKLTDARASRKICLLKVVERRTQDILILTIFPFLLLALMVLSRTSIFEGTGWSWGLIVVYASLVSYLLISSIRFNKEATSLRRTVESEFLDWQRDYKKKLVEERANLAGSEISRKDFESELKRLSHRNAYERFEINEAFKELKELESGAFRPWYRHPIFQSIAVPSGGTSGLILLQNLLN